MQGLPQWDDAWRRYRSYITSAWSPWVIQPTEGSSLRDEKKSTDTQQHQMNAEDRCHSVPIAPPVFEEAARYDLWAKHCMVDPTEGKNSSTHEVKDTHNEERIDIVDISDDSNTPAETSYVRQQDESLLVEGKLCIQMGDLKGSHSSCPEDDETCVSYMSTE